MPRPILRTPQQPQNVKEHDQKSMFSTRLPKGSEQVQSRMSRMELDRLLRKQRSGDYIEAVHRLDSGAHVHNGQQTEEIIRTIRSEFPELEISGVLLGVVSRCYLGAPYEVHSLDMTGSIVEHYKRGEAMPNGLERARSIALCGSYDFVEVYVDCCRAVSSTGAVSVIK